MSHKIKRRADYCVDDTLIYDPALYDAQDDFDFDVPFYLKQARRAKGPVLELCCGTGRITLPLAKAGIDITGVDFTPSMLRAAREKAAKQNLQVLLVAGDMRKIRLKKKFELVFIPFNSLQNTYSLADLERVFTTVKEHMTPGARFVFDIFNPSLEYMVQHQKLHKGMYKFRTKDGRRVTIDQSCRYDAAGQVNRTTWTFHLPGKKPASSRLDMRCFYPLEMDALLKYNWFRTLQKFGSFDETPFASDSTKQIYICRSL